jgi:hypothetical protein
LTSYYDILGISQSAGVNEIKRAFRRLAKLYHPDKNPGEKELFAGILKAYETLVDPALRSAYDRKLRYQQQQNSSAEKTKSKNWTFEEREQRRRKYYEEHIKQYEKPRPNYKSSETVKNNYNEFKYILFATPLAVALLLLVIRLATPSDENAATNTNATTLVEAKSQKPALASVFGQETFDDTTAGQIELNNQLESNVLLCLFSNEIFVRSCFLSAASKQSINRLPQGPFTLRMIMGAKDEKRTFYFSKTLLNLNELLQIDENLLHQMQEVEETEFFILNKTQ